MVFRGTFKQIANAAFRHPEIRACLIQNVMHELDIECKKLCSVPNVKSDDSKRAEKILKFCPSKKKSTTAIQPSPSCLRLTGKEEIVQFSLEKFDKGLSEQAPLMRLALMTMSWRRNKNKDLFFTPSVCMAAAVCLKNRSRGMIALQLILTLMMQHSGFMVRKLSFLIQMELGNLSKSIFMMLYQISFATPYLGTFYVNMLFWNLG